jgi:hypothetical protein
VPTVFVLFAFASDLSELPSEFYRYAKYDTNYRRDPVVKAICVVGGGYWYHRVEADGWMFHTSTAEHDELIDLVSGIVNTLSKTPPSARVAPLGRYLMQERPATIVGREPNA